MGNTNNGTTPGFATPNEKALGACDSKRLMTDTNSADYRSHGPVNHAHDGNTDDFALTITTTEARIDSRLLAQGFGNKHKPTMTLIDRYADNFKALGQLTFKKTVGKRKQGGGNAERYALLNEDQAYFLLSLSRNSATVVGLKVKLVKAFGNARRAADIRKAEYLPGYHKLHDTVNALASGSSNASRVHQNINKLLNKFAGIEAGQRASAALPQQALLIVGQLVASKAAQSATDHHDGYQSIKSSLSTLQGALALGVSA